MLWTVFHPARRSGGRTVIRRTAKQLSIVEAWARRTFSRDSDLWSFEQDFHWAMKPQRDESPPPRPQLEFDFVKSLVRRF